MKYTLSGIITAVGVTPEGSIPKYVRIMLYRWMIKTPMNSWTWIGLALRAGMHLFIEGCLESDPRKLGGIVTRSLSIFQ